MSYVNYNISMNHHCIICFDINRNIYSTYICIDTYRKYHTTMY